MKADMSDYGVTELTPKEASSISGGWGFWGGIGFGVFGILGLVAATIVEGVVRSKMHG
ncbi:hypothetical protein GCM10007880_61310 [Mesorhizobium amorphae]|uniref:hypothetical protein n=1 Tax=Mesorhizobium amorphae TaxID=71433 RepID=UPI00235D90D7|nr:hypothetical protein [Mesorhizobium amorphae]GLR45613.1 hypothetical protein GCM10007880_61310 [Mesorhizobium amorphae]